MLKNRYTETKGKDVYIVPNQFQASAQRTSQLSCLKSIELFCRMRMSGEESNI